LVVQPQSIGVASSSQGYINCNGILGLCPIDLNPGTLFAPKISEYKLVQYITVIGIQIICIHIYFYILCILMLQSSEH
ncbi:hypothetical protein K493DRAFT_246645, partial [Basidiobolus meristosporus CBS 931.73]